MWESTAFLLSRWKGLSSFDFALSWEFPLWHPPCTPRHCVAAPGCSYTQVHVLHSQGLGFGIYATREMENLLPGAWTMLVWTAVIHTIPKRPRAVMCSLINVVCVLRVCVSLCVCLCVGACSKKHVSQLQRQACTGLVSEYEKALTFVQTPEPWQVAKMHWTCQALGWRRGWAATPCWLILIHGFPMQRTKAWGERGDQENQDK
jgi:hypothetical protein